MSELRGAQASLHLVEVNRRLCHPAQHHQVVARAIVSVSQDDAVREDLKKGRYLALYDIRAALVKLDEYRGDAAWIQVFPDLLKELLRVKRRCALDPRVERIGCDGVKLLSGRKKVVSRVVQLDTDLRVADDVIVVFAEILRNDLRYERFDFDYGDAVPPPG